MRYEEREKSDFGIWGFDEKKKREERSQDEQSWMVFALYFSAYFGG